jgi:asparagine synthase (glutamine-hydrolysing)
VRVINVDTRSPAEGVTVSGGSDTAVLLAACAHWGVAEALSRCVGMFAFALWDLQTRTLWLARDRLGIKPLYWYADDGSFCFASQPKAIRAGLGTAPEIDRRALATYLELGYIPAPHSIHAGMAKLPPGTVMRVDADGAHPPVAFWDLAETVRAARAAPFTGSYAEAVGALDARVRQAVTGRLVSDVPLGAFLSGGVDSSLVVAAMQQEMRRPARTFSIGFAEGDYNETPAAEAVARHLGTDHTTLTATPEHALELVERLAEVYDEPFADSSQLPTLLLSRLTRQHVAVALSGDGGDETFAGYNRYRWLTRIARVRARLGGPLSRGVAAAAHALPPSAWRRLVQLAARGAPPPQAGEQVHKAADVLRAADLPDAYRRTVAQWRLGTALVPGARPYPDVVDRAELSLPGAEAMRQMQLWDTAGYLSDDILTKVDRASMAASLEVRVPLLDHRVVAFGWQLPDDFLIDAGGGKRILRDVLARYVPREITDRPKTGFAVPIGAWLRGPLRAWAAAKLDPERLRAQGLIDPETVQKAWREHLSGRANRAASLWTVLMFQSWYERL